MIGENTPNIRRLLDTGFARPMTTVLPAVTCTVQATLLTGLMPSQHGIVANGWYFRDLAEVMFWKQSNHLIHGERVFQTAKNRDAVAHDGQDVLVVQHVRRCAVVSDATTVVSGGRSQSSGHLQRAAGNPRRTAEQARTISAVQLLGADGGHPKFRMDR